MEEMRRIIDKWIIIIILLICFLTSILFYQFNKNIEYEDNIISTQQVYLYYNQMLKDYYSNLNIMDNNKAKLMARAKLYMIYNMEQWEQLKIQDEEMYNAGNYDERIENYKSSAPEIFDYYQELKKQNSIILNQYIENSDEINMALSLYDDNFDYINGYYDSINNYIQQANNTLLTDVYSNKNSFDYINLLKSKHDFRKLFDITVQPDNSQWLEEVISSSVYNNVFILLIILICVFKFLDNKKNGLIYIIYASKKGRTSLAVKRIIILGIVSIISTFSVYLCQFIISFKVYGGFEFMNNSLQSHQKYATICFTSSKYFFVIAFIFLSALAEFMTGLIVWFLISLFNNIVVGMELVTILLGILYVMYVFIPNKSSFAILKVINIWSVIIPIEVVSSYGNIGIWKFILDKINATLIIEIIQVIIFSIGCLISSSVFKTVRKINIFNKISENLKILCQKVICRLPIIFIELYKLFWVRKGIFVLAVIIIIVLNSGIKKGYVYDSKMIVAMNYYKEADGMVLSDELINIVTKYENEKQFWEDRLKIISIANAQKTNEFSREDFNEANMQLELYKNGVDEIHRNINNLNNLKEKGICGIVTSPFAVEEMFGEKLYNHQQMCGLLSVLGLIFLLFGVISDEKKHNMMNLIHASKKGRIEWFLLKSKIVLIVTTIVWSVVFIPNMFNIVKVYDVLNKDVIIQDYPLLSFIPIEMSLKKYILYIMIWRFILLLAIAGIIVFISSRFNYLMSLIISLALILTHLLCLLGFEQFYYLSIVSPLMVSQNWNKLGSQINGIILLIIGCLCWCITFYKEVKKYNLML